MTQSNYKSSLLRFAAGEISISDLSKSWGIIDTELCSFEELKRFIRIGIRIGKSDISPNDPDLLPEERTFLKALPMTTRKHTGDGKEVPLKFDHLSDDELNTLIELAEQWNQLKTY